jgi:hypothetical protein
VKDKMGGNTMRWRTSVLVATVLLVLISGCSSLAGHSVTGTWKQDASQGATTAIAITTFRADGTGSYKSDITTPGLSQMDWHISYDFTWQAKDHSGAWQEITIVPKQTGSISVYLDYYPDKDALMGGSVHYVRIS